MPFLLNFFSEYHVILLWMSGYVHWDLSFVYIEFKLAITTHIWSLTWWSIHPTHFHYFPFPFSICTKFHVCMGPMQTIPFPYPSPLFPYHWSHTHNPYPHIQTHFTILPRLFLSLAFPKPTSAHHATFSFFFLCPFLHMCDHLKFVLCSPSQCLTLISIASFTPVPIIRHSFPLLIYTTCTFTHIPQTRKSDNSKEEEQNDAMAGNATNAPHVSADGGWRGSRRAILVGPQKQNLPDSNPRGYRRVGPLSGRQRPPSPARHHQSSTHK